MNTRYIASILALSVGLTFACGDDDDSNPSGTAGTSGTSAGGDSSAGEGPDAGGNAGADQGGTSSQAGASAQAGSDVGGAGGAPGAACEFGDYGEGGATDVGGAAGAGGQASAGFELVGTWEEEFIGPVEITSSFWNDAGIAAYDSEANLVYTQTPCDAMYNPGRFSKIVYTDPAEDAFYYCMVVFDAETLAAAQASDETADPEDLETGCGASGFPWSKVTRQ